MLLTTRRRIVVEARPRKWELAAVASACHDSAYKSDPTGAKRPYRSDTVQSMNGILGKSVLVDELKPELGAKIVKAIIDDNERARSGREAREAKKKAAAKAAAKAAKKRNKR
jgi:hypothetical protein